MLMGQLLGIKIVASEFVAYVQLADLNNIENIIRFNNEKSVVMATYMLCGFANFASIGIQIGGIGIIAPKIKPILIELGFKAMVAGALVSLVSATIAGVLVG
jgi:CNT family concentrative nucleoside transporter